MANRFACTNEKVKALVAVSGQLLSGDDDKTESYECSRSLPVLHMHGDADPVVPYNGCSKDTSIFAMCRELAAIPGGGRCLLPMGSLWAAYGPMAIVGKVIVLVGLAEFSQGTWFSFCINRPRARSRWPAQSMMSLPA